MLRFLLEGSLGDILAPVTGTLNQLNLAIQHQRNNEITAILAKEYVDLSKIGDSGYATIHVACRFNNRFAFDLILGRGVSVDLPDATKNTPLHYAARYGNIELCRLLVEKGASPVARNDQHQTAYDVADNHIVRQYLLPLQLQSERQSAQDTYSFAPSAQMYGGGSYSPAPGAQAPAAPTGMPYPPAPIASAPSSSASNNITPVITNNSVPIIANSTPPPIFAPAHLNLGRQSSEASDNMSVTPTQVPVTPTTPSSFPLVGPPPPPTNTQVPMPMPATRQVSGGNARVIQPDGFHSSASDPNLQAKYGHIKEVVNIAPPPTGPLGGPTGAPPMQYSMFTGPGATTAPQTYSRYVPYDPNASAPSMYSQPVAQHSYGLSSYGATAQAPMLPTYNAAPPPTGRPQSAPVPPSQPPPIMQPPPVMQPPPSAPLPSGSTPRGVSSPPRPLDLLGNRQGFQQAPNVFSPDAEIVTFDSNSKSVM